ncbi:hypothetical protein TNCV_4964621 [Trichonephila clavipes]|nr:hypothetical protein TNCV_4964621 [Trichonephila clavipes]
MLHDDEIVTSTQAESDVDETDENKDNNNESSKGIKCWDVFCVRDRVVRTTIRELSYSTTAVQENRRPCSEKTKVYNGTAKNK